jgi:phage tail-like protein
MALKNNYFRSANWAIELAGQEIGLFTEVSGIEIEFGVVEQKMGSATNNSLEAKMAGQEVPKTLTLKRGLTTDSVLLDWFDNSLLGKLDVRDLGVGMYDMNFELKAEFSITECWPTKLTTNALNASAKEVVIEEVTFAYGLLEWK